MKPVLIVCNGYFGDHLFANSIAEHLLRENKASAVDYVIGFPQVEPFFKENPFIRNTFVSSHIGPNPVIPSTVNVSEYGQTHYLPPLTRREPPALELQKFCGVETPSTEFRVYTVPYTDAVIKAEIDKSRELTNGPVLAIMNNWQPKAFRFTKEEYERGIDVPYKGYGGRLRDIPTIINTLSERYATIMVGAPETVNQFQVGYGGRTLAEEASIIKACDFFIGAEGGLANIAAGVGCKTILTSDYVHQLYGWNGVIQKLAEPKLGPRYYFSEGHVDLDPYLTDEEVVSQIISIIDKSTLPF